MEKTAPAGHIYLQIGRRNRIKAETRTATIRIDAMGDNSLSDSGIMESNSQAAKTTYFMQRKYLSALNALIFFGKGILLTKSCKIPNGQILSQTARP
jgi:hypothetical protein